MNLSIIADARSGLKVSAAIHHRFCVQLSYFNAFEMMLQISAIAATHTRRHTQDNTICAREEFGAIAATLRNLCQRPSLAAETERNRERDVRDEICCVSAFIYLIRIVSGSF
jgi:hypothetical protein